MSPEAISVGVVIPVYNRARTLELTLSALTAQTHPAEHLTVVVADDGSEEDIRSVVEQWSPPFAKRYVHQEHDGFGAGRARNLGARGLVVDALIFLDSDGIVGPDFVAGHARWHQTHPKAVVIGGRVHLGAADLDPSRLVDGSVDLDSLIQEDRGDFRSVLSRRTSNLRATDEPYRAFVSSNVSVPAGLFAATGGFEERFRWWGSEDSELGWRLWQAGAEFIADPATRIYHQTDADTAGGAEGRQEARELNRGLLVSLVPQRFYRKGMPDPPPEVPKFSVIVHDVPVGAPREMWRALSTQSLPDFEVIFLAEAADHDPFSGAATAERRIAFIPDLDEAVTRSRGEYLVLLDGHAAPGATLLQNLRKRLDGRPVAAGLSFGIETPEGTWTRVEDIAELSRAWGTDLPLGFALRRRRLILRIDQGEDVTHALDALRDGADVLHTTQPLIALPGAERTARPEAYVYTKSEKTQLQEAVRLGAGPALRVGLRVARRRIRPEPVRRPRAERAETRAPGVRYVGWVGKENLGDEAMLEATRRLLGWGEVEVRGEARDLLLLGGGTLINRSHYLGWLLERDSPRLERAIFGTGVASTDYWGLTEDTEEWLRWLGTCAYVGVRGPRSAQTLSEWGYRGPLEICGDPALALGTATSPDPDGPILVAPAWTNGELWGESDLDVYRHLAGAIRQWRAQGREVVLMSCHPSDDRPILIIKEILDGVDVGYRTGYLDVTESLELIASSSVVVGERLHACVLAAAAGRPFVGLEYRPKVLDFAESVGMEDHVIRTDSLTDSALIGMVERLGSEPPAGMTQAVSGYRAKLEEASRVIERAVRG